MHPMTILTKTNVADIKDKPQEKLVVACSKEHYQGFIAFLTGLREGTVKATHIHLINFKRKLPSRLNHGCITLFPALRASNYDVAFNHFFRYISRSTMEVIETLTLDATIFNVEPCYECNIDELVSLKSLTTLIVNDVSFNKKEYPDETLFGTNNEVYDKHFERFIIYLTHPHCTIETLEINFGLKPSNIKKLAEAIEANQSITCYKGCNAAKIQAILDNKSNYSEQLSGL